jgi:hypothetical protein
MNLRRIQLVHAMRSACSTACNEPERSAGLSRYSRNRKYVQYVPKLLPPQLPAEAVTWRDDQNNRARIIALLKEGKSYEEISDITRCRLAFVSSVIRRYLNPEPHTIESKPAAKPVKAQRLHDCYCCGTLKSWKWYVNDAIGELCAKCYQKLKRYPTPRRKPPRIPCVICCKMFRVYPSQLKKGKRFCSHNCFSKSGLRGKNKNPARGRGA